MHGQGVRDGAEARGGELTVVLATTVAGTAGARRSRSDDRPRPGAAGVGDPYFPLDGNGGYDVDDYDLAIRYDPATDVLQGTAKIRARATQALSSFNLDLVGLTVLSVEVELGAARRSSATATSSPSCRGARCASGPASGSSCATRASRRRSKIRCSAGSPASSTPTTARSSPGNPTWRRRGTRSTITRATPRRTVSTITVPAGLEAVANGVLARQAHPQRLDHVDMGGPRADGVVPDDGHHRRVRPQRLPCRRDPLLGRARPRHLRAAAHGAHRRAGAHLAGGRTRRTSASPAPSPCRPVGRP